MTDLLAATSQVEITPPVGAPLLGPCKPSTGVHDPLFARALVLCRGEQRVALVGMDLIGMELPFADEIRAAIRQATGVSTTLLSCTHTHSAPFTIPWSCLGWQWCENDGQPWIKEVAAKVTGIVRQAAAAVQPASLRAGRAPAQVGVNRRLPTEQGIALKPNPDGVVVPWVDVLRVDDAHGAPMAIVFSHAAHPVIIHAASTLVSADYPGYAVDSIRRRVGGKVMPMFAQACCGNINGEPLRGGFDAAKRKAEALADAVLEAASQSERLSDDALAVASATIDLPFGELPSRQACEQSLRDAEAAAEREPGWYTRDHVLCLRDLLARIARGQKQTLRFEMNMVSVGDQWCLLAMPHEVFADYQLWFDQAARFQHKMVWAYTNGCESYIPTDSDFALGGYEAATFPAVGAALRYRHRVALAPGGEVQIKQAIGGLLRAETR